MSKKLLIKKLPNTLGPEIECLIPTVDSHKIAKGLPDGWTSKFDSSILPGDTHLGREFVRKDENYVTNIFSLSQICRYLISHGTTVNENCALHMHVGVTNCYHKSMHLDVVKQTVVNFMYGEKMLKYERATSTCDFRSEDRNIAFSKTKVIDFVNKILDCKSVENIHECIKRHRDRSNSPIWVQRFSDIGTIEFRGHAGTIAPLEVAGFGWLCSNLVDQAAQMVKQKPAHIPTATEKKAIVNLVNHYEKISGRSKEAYLSPLP